MNAFRKSPFLDLRALAALEHLRFAAHLAMVRQFALAGACDYRRVSTAIPYLETLGGFLVERAG